MKKKILIVLTTVLIAIPTIFGFTTNSANAEEVTVLSEPGPDGGGTGGN